MSHHQHPSVRRSTVSVVYSPVAHSTPAASRSPSSAPSTSLSQATGSTAVTSRSASDIEDIDERSDVEKELFNLVNHRKAREVEAFLVANPSININQHDATGMSVLHLAVSNNDPEVIDVLLHLSFQINMDDPLLHAVKENLIPIVHQLLNWQDKLHQTNKLKQFKKSTEPLSKTFDTSEYGNDVTPLMMAASCGHYELVELFYNRGDRLGDLKLPRETPAVDLQESNQRLHLLKALANPVYMAVIAGNDKNFDPIFEAFRMVGIIKKCIHQEPEFKEEYKEIKTAIKQFPVDLLSVCRSEDETKTLLEEREGCNDSSCFPYPRLLLALELKQRAFVAHTNAQDVISQKWKGERRPPSSFAENCVRKLTIFLAILCSPLTLLIFGCALFCGKARPQFVKFMALPINRFRSSAVSYGIFFAVICSMNKSEKSVAYRGPPSNYLPWIVGLYGLSHFFTFLRHLLISPKIYFFKSGWTWFEIVNHIFFFVTIGFWIHLALSNHSEHNGTKVKHTLERGWLDSYDVLLCSEIMTAVFSTMAGLRLLKIFILQRTLGPMQIALGKMTKDIFSFVLFFAVIVISFALGVQHLYRPYESFHDEPDHDSNILSEFNSAAEGFFFALFTMTDAGSPAITPFKMSDDVNATLNRHIFTESVGKLVFISFHVLCVTFLMNMLVGVMSSTYSKIQENAHVEWKYGRTKMWIYYMQDSVVAPPFNIIPNVFFLFNFTNWRRSKDGCSSNRGSCCSSGNVESEDERKKRKRAYRNLIRRLLQRYFRSKNSVASEDPPSSEDVHNIQNHVTDLRNLTTMSLDHLSDPSIAAPRLSIYKPQPIPELHITTSEMSHAHESTRKSVKH